jgi:transposase InsO family protein
VIRGIRHDNPGLGLERCCRLLGLSRQAYYQHFQDLQAAVLGQELAIREVLSIRALQPAIGGRKLYAMLAPFLSVHRIKVGRDGLFDLLAAHGLLIKRKRRRAVTTYSGHWLRRYPNLIRDRVPTGPNQIWVSDITYYMTAKGFVYISFITDAYSRKIVGYHAAGTLEAVHTLEALRLAVERCGPPTGLTHHSDRGVQYCSAAYVGFLLDNGIAVSMTENGDPLENAIAERLNGIMKAEFLDHYRLDGLSDVVRALQESVTTYNTLRPHMSCGMQTPENVHANSLKVERKWKNYYPKKITFVNLLQD